MSAFGPMVDGFYNVNHQLPGYLQRKAKAHFEEERAEKRSITTIEGFESRREDVRDLFLESIGGLPTRDTPLTATTTGTISMGEYSIEKVIFESLSDFHVTGNLYVPDEYSDPAPGILLLCGHSSVGKACEPYQKVCSQLARNGFVVFSIDPLGQGERRQYYDVENNEPVFPRVTEAHSYIGQQCAYAGGNVARYFIWDAIRGLDYLESRQEVDENRIGVTGNSGGGTQTAYLMLCDDRPQAAVPCCYITDREEYMKTGQAHDAEQNVYRSVSGGINYDDFVSAFAPKPVRIGAAQSDFFCIDGAHQAYERAESVYELYNASENVSLAVADSTHGYSEHLRNKAVQWFCNHLKDTQADIVEGPLSVLDEEKLACTDPGQVVAAYENERTVYDLNRRYIEKRHPNAEKPLAIADEQYAAEIQQRVTDRLQLNRDSRKLHPRFIDTSERGGYVLEKVFFKSEPDIVVTGITIRSSDSELDQTSSPQIVLLENGTDDVDDRWQVLTELVDEHGLVFVFDPRGVGGVKPRRVNVPGRPNSGTYYGHYGTEFKLSYDAVMLGESLFGMRVFDVLRAHEFLTTHVLENSGEIGLVGEGVGSLYSLYAAAAESEIRSLTLVDPKPSFVDMASTKDYDIDYRLFVHGMIGTCDLPQVLPALSDREIRRSGSFEAL